MYGKDVGVDVGGVGGDGGRCEHDYCTVAVAEVVVVVVVDDDQRP